jgi:hypothetical protein
VSTLVATRDVPSEDVVAGRTRIADDHELAARYPDCWKRDVYSDSVHRGAGVPPVNGKPGQAENRRVLNKATQAPTRGTEVAAVALRPDGSRTRRDIDRVVLGKGMLTPTRSFERNGEKFVANVNRVAPEAAVCRDPEAARLLRPCWEEEYDARVVELFERSTGQRWDPRPGHSLTPARASASSSRPLYGTPEYEASRRPRRDGDASFVGPILTQWMKR